VNSRAAEGGNGHGGLGVQGRKGGCCTHGLCTLNAHCIAGVGPPSVSEWRPRPPVALTQNVTPCTKCKAAPDRDLHHQKARPCSRRRPFIQWCAGGRGHRGAWVQGHRGTGAYYRTYSTFTIKSPGRKKLINFTSSLPSSIDNRINLQFAF